MDRMWLCMNVTLGAESASELFKGSKDWANHAVCNEKIFSLGFADFL